MRLYLPAIVLLCWAATWSIGLRGDGLLAGWLLILALATGDHIRHSIRRYRDAERT